MINVLRNIKLGNELVEVAYVESTMKYNDSFKHQVHLFKFLPILSAWIFSYDHPSIMECLHSELNISFTIMHLITLTSNSMDFIFYARLPISILVSGCI